jgi:hypothetical protein
MTRLVLLFAMLTACTPGLEPTVGMSADDGPQPKYRWTRELVIVRHIGCDDEAERAVEFWHEQGATYLELEAVDELPGTIWEQPRGTIDLPHELGHALGLVHADEPRVMYPDIGDGIPWETSAAEREWVSQ